MKWFKRISLGLITVILMLLVFVWACSPFIARSVINSALADYSVELTSESRIRLNPFSSSVHISNLEITANGQIPFSLNALELQYNLPRILFSEVRIQKIRIDGIKLEGSLVDDQLIVAGIDITALSANSETETTKPTDSEEKSTTDNTIRFSAPSIELTDANIYFQYKELKNEVIIHKLAINDSRFQDGSAHTDVSADLSINGAEFSFHSQVDLTPNALSTNLEVALKKLAFATYQPLLTEISDEVGGELSINLTLAASIKEQQVAITNSNLSVELDDVFIKHTQADAALGQLWFKSDNINLQLNSAEDISVATTLSAGMKDLRLTEPETGDEIISLKAFDLTPSNLSYSAESSTANVPEIELTDLTFSDIAKRGDTDLPALLTVGNVSVNGLEFSEGQLVIRDIGIGGLMSNIVLTESGLVNQVNIDSSEPEPDEQASVDATALADTDQNTAANSQEGMKFRIDLIEATAPWKIAIEDDAQSPPFAKQFEIDTLRLQNIDNMNTDQPLLISLSAKDDAYFRLNMNSQLIPFKDTLSGRFEADVREFSLAEVSTYLENTLDLKLKAGQLDTDIEGAIDANQLDSTVDITLRGADFSAADSEPEETNLIGQTAIPLNVALNMLKDGNGNINLKVPVNGDINDPDFGMRYILGLVAKKAALAQAKNYLITAFVPYAQVVKVSMVAGSYALKVRFEDLLYEPGQTELSNPQLTFANQLAQLLVDKPKLLVQICPVATLSEADTTASEPEQIAALNEIASERAAAFKRFVLANSTIESSRLLLCAPGVDKELEATPRLEFKTE